MANLFDQAKSMSRKDILEVAKIADDQGVRNSDILTLLANSTKDDLSVASECVTYLAKRDATPEEINLINDTKSRLETGRLDRQDLISFVGKMKKLSA